MLNFACALPLDLFYPWKIIELFIEPPRSLYEVLRGAVVHFFFYLVDEDKGDERGEIFLGETSYVTNEGARINRYQDHENHGDPGADPKTERHVFPVCFAVEIFTLLQIIL